MCECLILGGSSRRLFHCSALAKWRRPDPPKKRRCPLQYYRIMLILIYVSVIISSYSVLIMSNVIIIGVGEVATAGSAEEAQVLY